MLTKNGSALVFALLAVWACQAGHDSKSDAAASASASTLTLIADATAPTASSTAIDAGPSGNRVEACDEIWRCLAKYAKPKLAPADITRFLRESRASCFHPQWEKDISASCLEFPPLGTDPRNGKLVDVMYEPCCGDVLVPNQGSVGLYYHAVPSTECCARRGEPLFSGGWGNYLGCVPPERFDNWSLRYPRQPGGPLEPATTSACHPGKLIFQDGFMRQNPDVVCEKTRNPDATGQRIRCRRVRPSPPP